MEERGAACPPKFSIIEDFDEFRCFYKGEPAKDITNPEWPCP